MKVFGLLVLTIGLGGGELSPQAENIKQSIDSINLTETSTVDLRPLYKAMDELPNLEERRELRKHMTDHLLNIDLKPSSTIDFRNALLEIQRIINGFVIHSSMPNEHAVKNGHLKLSEKEFGDEYRFAYSMHIKLVEWTKNLALMYRAARNIQMKNIESIDPVLESRYLQTVSMYFWERIALEHNFHWKSKCVSPEVHPEIHQALKAMVENYLGRAIRTSDEFDDWYYKKFLMEPNPIKMFEEEVCMSERAEQVKKKIDINVDLTTLPYLYSTGRSRLLIKSIVSVDDLEERRILWRHFAKKLTPIQFPGLSYFSQNALIMAIHNTMHQAVDYLLSKPKEMGGDCLMAFEFNIELLKWYKRLAIHYDSILHGRKKEIHQDGINSGKPNAPTCGDLRITVEDCYWAAVSSYVHELFVMERRFQGLTGNKKITSDELTIIRQRIETFLQRKIRTQKELDDWSLKNYQDLNFPSKELMLQILNQSATE